MPDQKEDEVSLLSCLVETVQMVTKQPFPGVSLFPVYLRTHKAH